MQEMQHPDGTVSREFFSDLERQEGKMVKRRRELQAQGYSVTRVAYIVKQGKYTPHQGSREMERRVRQMNRRSAKLGFVNVDGSALEPA